MLMTYLKITLRTLYREKLYALINIFGLTLGLSCCLVLGLYVSGELSYDRHWSNHDKIYRVVNDYTFGGNATSLAWSSQSVGPLLLKDYPDQVESYTRLRPPNGDRATVFRKDGTSYYWDKVYLADLNIFDVFDHQIIYGNSEGALDDGFSVAVSASFAQTYFGEANPVGEMISTDTADYRISLVFADLPEHTHLKYDVLISMNRMGAITDNEAQLLQMLGNISDYTYLQMKDGFDPQEFTGMFSRFRSTRVEQLARQFGMQDSLDIRLMAQPIAETHLRGGYDYDQPTGNRFYVMSFIVVATFILIIACINYVNLATARSMKRSREVGMRKVLGAERGQLIVQFLGESLFYVLVSTALTLGFVQLLLNFNLLDNLLGASFFTGSIFEPKLFATIMGSSIVIAIVSGLYPAFYLSSVPPIVALSSESQTSRGTSGRLRQALVFVQFTISICIIASTLLMAKQMRYVSEMSLGFDKEDKLLVPLRGADVIESFRALRNELLMNPNIVDVAMTGNVPGGIMGLSATDMEMESGAMEMQSVALMNVGDNFLSTMGIEVINGRDFSQRLLTDTGNSFVVNRTMVEQMGWSQPIGKQIGGAGNGMNGRVIGVVDDFHFASAHQAVTPLMMISTRPNFANANAQGRALATQTMVVSVAGGSVSEVLTQVRETMLNFDGSHPFEYEFLDDKLAQLYRSEQSVMTLTSLFSGVCIFISCLGLFGLASFTTERRTKEIGIRKVLGASSAQIIALLARGILVLIGVGAVVGAVISYIIINQWLSGFAYRAGIDPFIFVISAAAALAVAFITVALQSYRTVQANPIEALRYQ